MATYTVTNDADSGAGSLRDAIARANAHAGDDRIEFVLAQGERTITLTSGQLVVDNKATDDPGALVIDGDLNDDGRPDITIDGQGRDRVFSVHGSLGSYTQPATLDGLVITGGQHGSDDGGGINAVHADVTISHSIIADNRVGEYGQGGGIYARGGSLTIADSTIAGNVGGGDGYDGRGGGIYARNVTVTIDHGTIASNTIYGRSASGGGIPLESCYTSISDSNIVGNSAPYQESYPGAGGGIAASDGDLTIHRSTISGNRASFGGGIHANTAVMIANSTVANNSGYYTGGGMYLGGSADIINCTITGNAVSLGVGGVGVYGTLRMSNTIAVGNISGPYGPYTSDISGTIVSNGHNIFGNPAVLGSITGDRLGVAASHVFATLSRFGGGLLADHGGPTQTVALRDDPTNPALDRGAVGTGIATQDQRGLARDGTPDIGAFELGGALFTAGPDRQDLNLFDLADFPGARATDALAGNDVVTLSDTKRMGVLFYAGNGSDTITGSMLGDRVRGDAGHDRLLGWAGGDTLWGGDGNDRLYDHVGNDTAWGGNGSDVLAGGEANDRLGGDAGNDTVYGGNGNDRILGGPGNDSLVGGDGADTITGGAGVDRMRGDVGLDRFVFDDGDSGVGAARDVIVSFGALDVIDLAAIDAKAGVAGDQGFGWIGNAAFTAAGQLRFVLSGADRIVEGSTDADAAAEFQILLLGYAGTPNAGDFIL
jgi:Ca2+-binding RTX toxin-like protein